jgi:hypothetical protein
MALPILAGAAGLKALLIFLAAGVLSGARCFWFEEAQDPPPS